MLYPYGQGPPPPSRLNMSHNFIHESISNPASPPLHSHHEFMPLGPASPPLMSPLASPLHPHPPPIYPHPIQPPHHMPPHTPTSEFAPQLGSSALLSPGPNSKMPRPGYPPFHSTDPDLSPTDEHPPSEFYHGSHTPPHSIAIPPLPLFGPLSPPQNRVPMTPSMPGFTFHPFPQTPPLMPQFLSPGLGPFSPPLGGPSFANRPYMNAAPGAPIHLPPGGMHPASFNSFYGSSYFPSVPPHPLYEAPEPPDHHHHPISGEVENPHSSGRSTPSKIATSTKEMATIALNIPNPENTLPSPEFKEGEEDGGYFPPVSALLARRASTNSGAQLPDLRSGLKVGSPPVASTSLARDHRTASGTKVSPAAAAAMTSSLSSQGTAIQASQTSSDGNALREKMGELTTEDKVTLPRPKSAASGTSPSEPAIDFPRRSSVFDSESESKANVKGDPSTEARRRFEGENGENRRASFEASDLTRARQLAFGQSIWTSSTEWGTRPNK